MKKRIEQAAISAGRVFAYVAFGSLLATLAPFGTNQAPDLSTLGNAVTTAAYAGGIAVIGFGWNLLKPRVPIPPAT